MQDPLTREILEKKSIHQYGTMDEMLNLNPRYLIDGHVFLNKTNNKLYTIIPVQASTLVVNSIMQIRSGNFCWTEIQFSPERQGYMRGIDVLTHCKQIDYMVEIERDNFKHVDGLDCIVLCCNELSISNEKHRQAWKQTLNGSPNGSPNGTLSIVDIIDQLLPQKIQMKYNEEQIKHIKEKLKENSSILQQFMISCYETLFYSWLNA